MLQIFGITSDVRSDRIDSSRLPNWIKSLPVTGEIRLDRRFQEHPTATLTLFANTKSIKDSIVNSFSDRSQKFIIFDVPLRVDSIDIRFDKQTDICLTNYTITIQLQGFWLELLDKPIKLFNTAGANTNSPAFSDPQCSIDKPGVAIANTFNSVPVSAVAAKSGISYSGFNLVQKFPRNIDKSTISSFNDFFAEVSEEFGVFPFYSASSSVIGKKWNLLESAVISDPRPIEYNPVVVSVSFNNRLSNLNNLLPPTEVIIGLDDDTIVDEQISELPQPPTFAFSPPSPYTVSDPPDLSYREPPIEITSLRTLDLNYDRSGPYKTLTTTTYLEQNKLKEIIEIWGFRYNAVDIVANDKLNGDPSVWWQQCDYRVTDYLYDDTTGYLTGYNTSGYQYIRLKQETDQLETLILSEESDPDSLNELAAYTFKQVPLRSFNRKILAQLRDYYLLSNSFEPKFLFYQSCGSNGQLVNKSILNKNYVEPYFTAVDVTYFGCFSFLPNPSGETIQYQNNDIEFPPLISGEERLERREIKAIRSKATALQPASTFLLGDSATVNSEDPFYLVTESRYTAKEPNFSNYIAESSSSVSQGLPELAPRLNTGFNLLSSLDTTPPSIPSLPASRPRFFVSSPSLSSLPVSTSRSFPSLTSSSQALDSIRSSLEIDLFLNSQSIQVSFNFSEFLFEGSFLSFQLGQDSFSGRVKSVSHVIKILDHNLFSGYTDVDLSGYPSPPLSLLPLPLSSQSSTSESSPIGDSILDVFSRGSTIQSDSTFLDIIQSVPNRGNIPTS